MLSAVVDQKGYTRYQPINMFESESEICATFQNLKPRLCVRVLINMRYLLTKCELMSLKQVEI